MSALRIASVTGVLWAVWVAGPVSALERASARAPDRDEEWSAATGHLVFSYYNLCTGWNWVWSGWYGGEQVGVTFDLPNGAGTYCGEYSFLSELQEVWMPTRSGVPSGYGYTGTIEVLVPTPCGTPLASQPFLPPVTGGWVPTNWGSLLTGWRYAVRITWAAPPGQRNPTGLYSDHPMAGPTGPAACGTCYPTTRVSHTSYLGVDGAYCPAGVPLTDGLCDVELLMDVSMGCVASIGIEATSWAEVKSLYR